MRTKNENAMRLALRQSALLVLLFCSVPEVATAQSGAVPAYITLAERDVIGVEARLVRSITLGDAAENRPSLVADAVLLRGKVFVLDGMRRRVLVYDSTGKFLRRVADWGRADGELESPYRLALTYDTLLVLDITHNNSVNAFDRDGNFIGARFPTLHRLSASSLALGNTVAVFERPGRTVVSIRDRQGKELASGCVSADGYQASEKRQGIIRRFTGRIVALRNNRIYCAQTITPVVTVLDLSGNAVDYIAVAPPFYVSPLDIPDSRNQKTISNFLSRWTALNSFEPTPKGFMSIYTRYDLASSQFLARFFGCDVVGRPRNCFSGSVPGTPLRILSPDTVLTSVSGADGQVGLQVFRISR
jgi:hypothetical protein